MLLAAVEKELGIADRLAPLITDPAQSAAGDAQCGRHLARTHAGDRVRL